MSAASAQTFSYVNKQQQVAASYRYAIDDRFRWAQQVNEANFYAVSLLPDDGPSSFMSNESQQSPEHIMAASQQQQQQQHVYATPSRVQTPDALLSQDVFESRHNHYTRPSRSKSRNSTLHGHYQTNVSFSLIVIALFK